MHVEDAVSGLILGLSLIAAIGAQNIFVLRQGLMRSHVFVVCMTCALSDAVLVSIGIGGFSAMAQQAGWIEPMMRYAGACFLFLYGLLSLRRVIWPPDVPRVSESAEVEPLAGVLLACLAFTWLNPHVYLDTVFLIGGISTQYTSQAAFGTGVVASSFLFFFTLGYGARRLSGLFESREAWRKLDAVVTIVMWAIALKLLSG